VMLLYYQRYNITTMYQYISELRKKPDHHKRRFALAAAGAITGMIFIAWVSVLLPQNTKRVIAEDSSSGGITPISSLKNSAAQVVTATRELFSNTTANLDFESEYNKMKAQVESGEIRFVPDDPTNQ